MTDGDQKAALLARLRELSPEKRALFLKRFEQTQAAAPPKQDVAAIPIVSRTGTLPLSSSEARLWFLDQYQPGTATYNMAHAMRLRGRLDEDALERALTELAARHESLRTRFVAADGEPARVLDPKGPFALERASLEAASGAEREAELSRRVTAESDRPFDLATGPLFRGLLVAVDRDDHVLVLTMHHIVSDGWSLGVLFRELSTLYGAFARGEAAALPPLRVQYADYAAWERSPENEQRLERQLAYWTECLAEVPALELPTDRPRPATQSMVGDKHVCTVHPALTAKVKELGRQHRATLFVTVLGAFAVLLSRHSGQRVFAIGVPVAHRTRLELEPIIGFFVNTLPVRIDLSGDPTVRELLEMLRDEMFRAHANQDVPFERVVEELQPARDLSRSPIFQVSFTYQNTPEADGTFAGLEVEPYVFARSVSKFDLALECFERPDHLLLSLRYATALFDAPNVERVAGQLLQLLEGMSAGPDRRISELPILTEPERRRILDEWSGASREGTGRACVHELFEAQVERTPDAVALVFHDERVTYRRLRAMSDRAAKVLAAAGVRRGSTVALHAERSLHLIVWMLGAWKAGAAYLPIDPNLPQDRVSELLVDSEAAAVVWPADQPVVTDARVVRPEEASVADGAEEPPASKARVCDADLAYIIYTSGSTGKSKGVGVEHRQLRHYVEAASRRLELSGPLRYGMVSTAAADLGHTVLFPSLLYGGELHLLDVDCATDPALFTEYCRKNAIDVLKIVPSHFGALVPGDGGEPTLPRKKLVFGGEALRGTMVESLTRARTGCRIFNHYGPTETTVGVVAGPAPASEPFPEIIPLGRPLDNVRAYILDANMEPVPPLVPGQLFVGGLGVTRGYLRRPELTAERYVPDPFSRSPGARMYMTGDRVRWRPDGQIEFLGRADHQVKIRGFRVEPGEVDAALAKHPSVRASIVIAWEHAPGDKRLVAYVVPKDEAAPPTDLRESLQRTLPDYMVPSVFITLKELPLTANGKINRRALPAPEFGASAAAFVPPSTPTEVRLAAIWAELLKVERVGLEDNFFDLGGHSLLATRLVSRIARDLGVALSLRVLFETPKLGELAAKLDALSKDGARAVIEPLVRVARGGDLPLAYEEETFWRWHRVRKGGPVWNMCHPLLLSGKLDAGALERAVQALLHRHETLRMTIREVAGQPVRGVGPDSVPLDVVDLSDVRTSEERRARVGALADAMEEEPFDLERGPMLRTKLLRFEPERHVLLVCSNHIAVDGDARTVLLDDVMQLYGATIGARAPLAELPLQVADYAVWQRKMTAGAEMQQRLAYWRRTLEGAEATRLPVDKPRPAKRTFSVPYSFRFSKETVEGLGALAKQERGTMFAALGAALAVAFHGRSGQRDLVMATPMSTREQHDELVPVAGNLVDHVLLRADLSGEPTFRELLRRYASTTVNAFANAAPLQLVLGGESPMDHPLMQLVVNLFKGGGDGPPADNHIGELQFDPLGLPMPVRRVMKYDLLITLFQGARGGGGTMYAADDLFEASTMKAFASEYVGLLDAIVADPDRPIAELAAASRTP